MENKKLEKVKKRSFWKDETGDIGIKQIAITVAVIVLVGGVISFMKDGSTISGWISSVWNWLFEDILKKMVK
ncbi:TMEM14 family protein [Fontibacillus sp. BL9]|uniref:TMEM14 family protein n=1 Tax=Fontibacillus sp. BL9 TaxID=3389971 RepID=UPI00397C8DE8